MMTQSAPLPTMKLCSSSRMMISSYRERPVQKWLRQHTTENRFSVLVIHRRAGKTVFAVNKLIRDVLTCRRPNPRAHYFAPFYKMAKTIAWDYLRDYTAHIEGMVYNKTELTANFPGGQRIQLVGADNPDSFRGQYSDSVVMDEFAMMAPRTWSEVVRPALADREGSALFIGTPAGRNAFWKLYDRAKDIPGWWRCLLTYEHTGLIPDAEIASMRAEMDDSEFRQEMLCDFQAALRGAYFGKILNQAEAEQRIVPIQYDDTLLVWTAWDLGMADSTAVWFIQVSPGGEIRLIDYEEWQGTGLPEIIADIRKKPYQYDGHIAPHDIKVRELGTGTSRLEVAQKLGLVFQPVRQMPLMDGIDAARNILKKAWIDPRPDKAGPGLECLRLYRSEWDDRKRIYSTRPLHDHTSHAADALRMFAVHGSTSGLGWGRGLNYDMLDRMAV